VLLTSHLGRPKGKDDKYSLAPVSDRLTELLGAKVTFVNDCIGDSVATAVSGLKNGDVALLENGTSHFNNRFVTVQASLCATSLAE
jgi:phosphoglycerate kinase